MIVASFVLGFLNLLVMWLAFRGRVLLASAGCLLIQVPWTIYDIATHQYGFLLISAGSVFVAGPALVRSWRRRKPKPEKVPCPKCRGRGGWRVPAHVNYQGWGCIPAYWHPCPDCDHRGKVPAPVD
jgi:hypothetical protein